MPKLTPAKSPKHTKDYYLDYIRAEDRVEKETAEPRPMDLPKSETT